MCAGMVFCQVVTQINQGKFYREWKIMVVKYGLTIAGVFYCFMRLLYFKYKIFRQPLSSF